MKASARLIPPREGAVALTDRGPVSAARDALPDRAKIALIDDDWAALSRLREIIEQNSDLVAACRCAEGAMLAVQHCRPAVVILDVQLPDRDGFELVRDITATSEAKVIVFTAALQGRRSPMHCVAGPRPSSSRINQHQSSSPVCAKSWQEKSALPRTRQYDNLLQSRPLSV